MSLVIVMPAYNAARHLPSVLNRIFEAELAELSRIIVVNDGSRDDTEAVLAAVGERRCAIDHLQRPANGGYGAAMKDGLDAARAFDPELIACVHADGQYSPELLPALSRALRERKLDVLQGSRIAGGSALAGGMPLYKYAANAVLNQLENRTLGLGLSDYHSGYLLYSRRALNGLPYRRFSNSFDFDLEVIASARAHGLNVGEAPIPTHYGDEISHLQPIHYGLRVLRVLWNYRRGQYDPN